MENFVLSPAQERLLKRRWGVFNHFLYFEKEYEVPEGADPVQFHLDNWNRRVEMFDVERVAKDLHDVGAGYYFITIMQGSKYMIAPNATFDKIAGTKPGEACAKRDLIADLIPELAKYDIDLYLYYTGDGPYSDPVIGEKMGYRSWCVQPMQTVNDAFLENWSSVMEEYAVRYGDAVKGWWVDGCYEEGVGYNQKFLAYYYRAAKKGNPDALVAMNHGVHDDLFKWYEKEEITSGEFNHFTYIPKSRSIDGAMPHILAPIGANSKGTDFAWCGKGTRYSNEYMKDYVRKVNASGGVVTIDIGIKYDSTYYPEQLEAIRGI
ncbi:MAG: hypothetical protein IJ325_01985 [Clostridia bacterium]|nr:hypothetical protein [Clostridia bacterium]